MGRDGSDLRATPLARCAARLTRSQSNGTPAQHTWRPAKCLERSAQRVWSFRNRSKRPRAAPGRWV